jgi:hypothetical protein
MFDLYNISSIVLVFMVASKQVVMPFVICALQAEDVSIHWKCRRTALLEMKLSSNCACVGCSR